MLGPTHRAFATTVAATTVVALSLPHPLITIAVAGLMATVPDMDKHFKVFKHRGITHSIWPVVLYSRGAKKTPYFNRGMNS